MPNTTGTVTMAVCKKDINLWSRPESIRHFSAATVHAPLSKRCDFCCMKLGLTPSIRLQKLHDYNCFQVSPSNIYSRTRTRKRLLD